MFIVDLVFRYLVSFYNIFRYGTNLGEFIIEDGILKVKSTRGNIEVNSIRGNCDLILEHIAETQTPKALDTHNNYFYFPHLRNRDTSPMRFRLSTFFDNHSYTMTVEPNGHISFNELFQSYFSGECISENIKMEEADLESLDMIEDEYTD